MPNTLEENLELRKALAEVDRLIAKIVDAQSIIEEQMDSETMRIERWEYDLKKEDISDFWREHAKAQIYLHNNVKFKLEKILKVIK